MSIVRRHVFTVNSNFAISPRPAGDNNEPSVTLAGYAMTWGSISSDRGGYKVRLNKGSATFATPTFALYQHDFGDVLGSTANGTLRLTSDDTGVRIECDLPDTTVARDVAELVEDSYVTGMSFSMIGNPIGKMVTENGQKIFVVDSFECDEVSIVSNPAFGSTLIEVKPPDDGPPPAAASFVRARLTPNNAS